MDRRVVPLQPRARPLAEAVAAYRAGAMGTCIDSLRSVETDAGRLLCARAFFRLGHYEAVLERTAFAVADGNHRVIGERAIVQALALARLGRFDDVDAVLSAARVHALASPNAALEAEFHYADAAKCFMLGDFERMTRLTSTVLKTRPFAREEAPAHFVPLGHSRARALELTALFEGHACRVYAQAAATRQALDEVEASEEPDALLAASLLANLSFLVRDLGLLTDAAFLRQRLEGTWPSEATLQRYAVLRSLAWCNVLAGDHVGALRDLRGAAEVAPSASLKLLATLDRAMLARELHEGLTAREELEYAERLSAQVDWNAVQGDERVGLLLLAEALAQRSASKARSAFDRYRTIKTKLSATMAAKFDRRWRAMEAFAEATVLRAERQRKRSAALFVEAFETWVSVGYAFNAARAALEIAEMTGEPRFVEYARSEAQIRPHSWLARRALQL